MNLKKFLLVMPIICIVILYNMQQQQLTLLQNLTKKGPSLGHINRLIQGEGDGTEGGAADPVHQGPPGAHTQAARGKMYYLNK